MNSSPTYGRVVEINHRWTWLVEDGSDFSQCTTPLLPHSYFLFYSKHDVSNSLVDFWLGNACSTSPDMEEPTGDYVSVFFSVSELTVTSIFSFSSSLEKVLRQIRRSNVSFLRDFQRMYSMLHSYKTKFHSHQRSSAVYLQTTGNSRGGFLVD